MTAVIVGHDGAGWLAHGLDALLEQTRPVQRVVAVDTGSRDRSGAVLAGKLGQGAVFGMERSTGYAAAVRRALQHKAASAPLPVPAGGQGRGRAEQIEWIWLLHDDCEPAPDALEQLLRGAAETPAAAVLGPKLMDWADRDVILEAGLALDGVGRRITGIEPREVDQGQHDGDRDVLAVSSAGMLIRRDVWDQVGGFEPGMMLFGEDIDLCWRVQAAGYRVRVITDAVVYHALAATRGRRPISVGRRARLLDRRNGLLTLLGNLPTAAMLAALLANLTISLVRTAFYLVAKRGTAALDESAAVAGIVVRPLRLVQLRRRRARGRRAAYGRLRADLPAGHSVRRMVEFVHLVLSRSAKQEAAAAHSAIDDPTDDDSLLIDSGFVQRFVTRPGVLMVLGLMIVTGVAERSLLGGGPLGGGALLPAWEGASQLWREVLQAFHPVGIGSASVAPPYAGFVALLATILLGKVWLAVDVLLLGSVPLAGVTALLALRRVTQSALIRVWAATSYALLPVAFGAISAGRLGSAVAFALTPLIGLVAGRMLSERGRPARRAAWATGLIVTVATAFVPLLWPMAVIAAMLAAILLPRSRAALINLGIAAVTPFVLLLPWLLQLLAHPSGLLLEAGVQQPGLASAALPARSLLLLSPGGPGLPPYWTSAALLLTGLAALLATRQRSLIVSGWAVALLGFAAAAFASRMTVTPAGGQPMTPWPGPALAVAAAGLLLAAAAGAGRAGAGRGSPARGRRSGRRSGLRGAGVAVLGMAAVSAPLLAAGYWLLHGVAGPVAPATGQVVPALVSDTAGAGLQLRTLVLSSDRGHVSYVLLRGGSPDFIDADLVPSPGAQTALTRAVAALTAPGGGEAADQSQLLARFDIGFVLIRTPVPAQLASVLSGVAGLTEVSISPAFDLWRLTTLPSRVSVAEPGGKVVAIGSGPIGVAAAAPSAGGILELAEPAGGWSASLNGHALTAVPSPAGAWAQAFRLPAGGGTLTISRDGLIHDLVAALELLAFVVVAVLALPGVRTAAEIEAAVAAEIGASVPELEDVSAGVSDGTEAEPGHGRPGRAGRGGRVGRAGRAGRGRVPAAAGLNPNGAPAAAGLSRGRVRAAKSAAAGGDEAQPAARSGHGAARPPRGRRRAAAGLGAGGVTAAGMPGAGAVAGGAAGAAAGAVGAAAAGAGASGAAGAGAGAAGAGRAAWPAGQPASRFMSGPPESRPPYTDAGPGRREEPPVPASPADPASRRAAASMSPSGTPYDTEPGRRGSGPAGAPYGTEPGRRGSGPAGAPYGTEPGRRGSGPPARPFDAERERPDARPPLPYSDERAARAASPSGSRYDDLPGGPPAERRPYLTPPAADRPADPYAEPAYRRPGNGQQSRPPAPGWQDSGWHDQGGWPAADQPSRRADEQGSGWPEQAQQPGWPQGSEPGSGAGPAWHVPGQSEWPEQEGTLEALPPPGEVHHDWPASNDRPRRGWLAPEDETDGETW